MLTPLFALGLVNPMRMTDGAIPAIVLITGSLWGYFIHANVRWRLRPMEWLIATPGFHHWHHAMGMQRNCNYSTMLPWVDRIFGTHHLPRTWPEGYGIPEPMAPGLLGQLAQPFPGAGRNSGARSQISSSPGQRLQATAPNRRPCGFRAILGSQRSRLRILPQPPLSLAIGGWKARPMSQGK